MLDLNFEPASFYVAWSWIGLYSIIGLVKMVWGAPRGSGEFHHIQGEF